jgi:hypothetical protein
MRIPGSAEPSVVRVRGQHSVRAEQNRGQFARWHAVFVRPRVKDGCHIWSQNYECSVEDVFEVQDEIISAIVQRLAAKLSWNVCHTPGPRLILSKPTLTKDLVAYDLYLQGLYLWESS